MIGPVWRHVRRLAHNRDGVAMVEFALVAPVLLLVLFAVVEFGRLVYAHGAINFAAQEATRFATVNFDATEQDLKTLASNRMIGIRDDMVVSMDVESILSSDAQTKLVTVEITYDHRLLLPVFNVDKFTLTGASKGFLVER